jgi:hypothetical protein
MPPPDSQPRTRVRGTSRDWAATCLVRNKLSRRGSNDSAVARNLCSFARLRGRHADCTGPRMSSHIRISLGLSLFGIVSLFGVAAGAQQTVGAQTTPGSPVSVFGNKGEIAISSEAGATFEHTSVSGVDGATTHFLLRPGVDYFLIKQLSLGAFVGIDYGSVHGASTTVFSIGPRVGYDIAFSDHFSIWPRAGFSFNSTKAKTDAEELGGVTVPSSSNSNSAVALNLFAPILFHTNRFFAGVGPALDTDLSGDAKATTFAVRVTLGGWVF